MIGLQIRGLNFGYFNRLILADINLTINPGEMVGLLGPNGSGKTTLIKLAAGILHPKSGEVKINGSLLNNMNRKAIARHLAVVPQQFTIPYAFTVKEVVMLGRVPFLKPLVEENEADHQVISEAMKLVGVAELAERRFDELSGGERQRVVMAMALAQKPEIILLDEPTVHLDISHQLQMLELVKQLNNTKGLTALAALHDLNMAALYFNRLVLLKDGRIIADGIPEQVLTKQNIEIIFSTPVLVEKHPVTGGPHVIITPKEHID